MDHEFHTPIEEDELTDEEKAEMESFLPDDFWKSTAEEKLEIAKVDNVVDTRIDIATLPDEAVESAVLVPSRRADNLDYVKMEDLIELGTDLNDGRVGFVQSTYPDGSTRTAINFGGGIVPADKISRQINTIMGQVEAFAGKGAARALADALVHPISSSLGVDQTITPEQLMDSQVKVMRKEELITDEQLEEFKNPDKVYVEEPIDFEKYGDPIKAGLEMRNRGDPKMSVYTSVLGDLLADEQFIEASVPKKLAIMQEVTNALVQGVDATDDQNIIKAVDAMNKVKISAGKAAVQKADGKVITELLNPEERRVEEENLRISNEKIDQQRLKSITAEKSKMRSYNASVRALRAAGYRWELSPEIMANDGSIQGAQGVSWWIDKEATAAQQKVVEVKGKLDSATANKNKEKVLKLRKEYNELSQRNKTLGIAKAEMGSFAQIVYGTDATGLGLRNLINTSKRIQKKLDFGKVYNVSEMSAAFQSEISDGIADFRLSGLGKNSAATIRGVAQTYDVGTEKGYMIAAILQSTNDLISKEKSSVKKSYYRQLQDENISAVLNGNVNTIPFGDQLQALSKMYTKGVQSTSRATVEKRAADAYIKAKIKSDINEGDVPDPSFLPFVEKVYGKDVAQMMGAPSKKEEAEDLNAVIRDSGVSRETRQAAIVTLSLQNKNLHSAIKKYTGLIRRDVYRSPKDAGQIIKGILDSSLSQASKAALLDYVTGQAPNTPRPHDIKQQAYFRMQDAYDLLVANTQDITLWNEFTDQYTQIYQMLEAGVPQADVKTSVDIIVKDVRNKAIMSVHKTSAAIYSGYTPQASIQNFETEEDALASGIKGIVMINGKRAKID